MFWRLKDVIYAPDQQKTFKGKWAETPKMVPKKIDANAVKAFRESDINSEAKIAKPKCTPNPVPPRPHSYRLQAGQ